MLKVFNNKFDHPKFQRNLYRIFVDQQFLDNNYQAAPYLLKNEWECSCEGKVNNWLGCTNDKMILV